jgi:hypothetical protein
MDGGPVERDDSYLRSLVFLEAGCPAKDPRVVFPPPQLGLF